MMVKADFTIEDYVAIAGRRLWLLIFPAVIGAILGYVISGHLRKRYVSETIVLVEGQLVPDSVVKPNAVDVNERLATMREEILSRTRLQQIIDKLQLYREDKSRFTPEEQIELLRKSITVSPVRPMAETRANGLPGFTVSVNASEALLAQEICTEITSFFMKQNILLRARRAEDTTDFLNKQLEDAKAKLDAQDSKLADFQRRYMGELPDEAQTNFAFLSGLTSQLEATSQTLSRAQQNKIFTESMLSQQETAAKIGQVISNPDTLQKQMSTLEEELSGLRLRYTDEHPDVMKVKAAIARLQRRIQDETAAMNAQTPPEPDIAGPVVETAQAKQLRAQLFEINQTIREKTAEQARLQQEFKDVQAKLRLSPAIAQEYKALTRDSQTALTVYNELLRKHSDSEMATDLERRQQGEQFRVLDPPSLPGKPSSPNRPLFGMGGLIGGLGLGLVIALGLELRDTTLRYERDVERILKLPTLAIIPFAKPSNGSDGPMRVPAQQSAERVIPRMEGRGRHV